MELLLIIIRWVQICSAMMLFGTSLFRLFLGPEASSLDDRLRRTLIFVLLLAFASGAGLLMVEAGTMGEGWPDMISLPTIFSVLAYTQFGHVWAVHLLVLPLIALAMWRPHSQRLWLFLVLASAAFLGSLALTGHAVMENGFAGFLHPLNQVVHLLAGGAWIGGLYPLYLALADQRPDGPQVDLPVRAAHLFAGFGYCAVALVVASGIVNGWLLLGDVSRLTTSFYGRVLLFKLVLVAAMIWLAALNRLVFAPLLRRQACAATALRQSVAAEALCAAGILAAASFLGTLPPSI